VEQQQDVPMLVPVMFQSNAHNKFKCLAYRRDGGLWPHTI